MDRKDYAIVGTGLAVLAALFLQPTHYCDSRQIHSYCYELSESKITCYTIQSEFDGGRATGGKRCTEGWKTISDALESPNLDGLIPVKNQHNTWWVKLINGTIDLDKSEVWSDKYGGKRCSAIGEVCV